MNFPAERSSAGVRFWRQDQRDQDGRPARMVWGGRGGVGLTRKGRAGLSSAGLGKRRRIQKWDAFTENLPERKEVVAMSQSVLYNCRFPCLIRTRSLAPEEDCLQQQP